MLYVSPLSFVLLVHGEIVPARMRDGLFFCNLRKTSVCQQQATAITFQRFPVLNLLKPITMRCHFSRKTTTTNDVITLVAFYRTTAGNTNFREKIISGTV